MKKKRLDTLVLLHGFMSWCLIALPAFGQGLMHPPLSIDRVARRLPAHVAHADRGTSGVSPPVRSGLVLEVFDGRLNSRRRFDANSWAGGPAALGYDDFPPELQQILDERIAELDDRGGICIAGRVTMSDGMPISGGEDVQVNFYHGADVPLWVYEGGWFIMGRTLSSFYAGQDRGFILRAFGYDPIDALIDILDGEITYLEFEMIRTPPENIASVTGTVSDENGYPFDGARVTIRFPFATHGYTNGRYTYPRMAMTTGPDGRYSFDGLSISEHSVTASASGYVYHYAVFTPPVGGTAVEDRRLYPNRRIVIDYVYQADGTRSFTTGDLESGTISWLNGEGGVDFSEGVVEGYEWDDLRDLEMRQDQDVLKFRNFYVNGRNGFYDAGPVDFDSVTEAAETGYSTREVPCLVGHVYVVRTYEEDNYAKFIVKTDEMSFRTVVPGDPDPIEFAGYGLTVDFSWADDYGQLFVEKHFAPPLIFLTPVLPYYWDISGMEGVGFSADLTIAYDEADLADLEMSEYGLVLLRSTDGGANWEELETLLNTANNTLTVEGLTSFSWFAIADLTPPIVDLRDFAGFQICFTGDIPGVLEPECEDLNTDGDGDVDLNDYGIFYQAMITRR